MTACKNALLFFLPQFLFVIGLSSTNEPLDLNFKESPKHQKQIGYFSLGEKYLIILDDYCDWNNLRVEEESNQTYELSQRLDLNERQWALMCSRMATKAAL